MSNRLSATLAELHTVKKAMEETETRARAEKALFEERTASFEQRIDQLSQRLENLLKNYQVGISLPPLSDIQTKFGLTLQLPV